jgi:hypothetical protein
MGSGGAGWQGKNHPETILFRHAARHRAGMEFPVLSNASFIPMIPLAQ